MGVSDYLVYLVIDFLFAVLPVLFYFTGRLGTTLIPSLVCVCISLVSFTAVLVFQGRALAGELSRRMMVFISSSETLPSTALMISTRPVSPFLQAAALPSDS